MIIKVIDSIWIEANVIMNKKFKKKSIEINRREFVKNIKRIVRETLKDELGKCGRISVNAGYWEESHDA
ncbi:MAG: hypothetical protein WC346_15085 [Methanogenium sp.]|jgi:hypothetical protein